jgi:acetyltransferase-like isoleucine patch superfamily enzyme
MKPILHHIGIVNVQFGQQVTIVEPVNLYDCFIGDQVFIGPFVEIQANVHIGHRTRIQSHTFICEGVTVGENCFIAHGVMFVNDTFSTGGPAGSAVGHAGSIRGHAGNKALWRPTLIGNRVSIGSNATILPVTICDDVVIGAGAVVTRDIHIPGSYAGNPARLLKKKDGISETKK